MNKTRTIKVNFIGSHHCQLAGRLELPAASPKAFIVFSHCFTCSKDIIIAYRSSRMLAQQGYAVLRYDFAGLGDSEGDFANCNFSTTVEDCLAAMDFLARNYQPPEILIGHSLGGTTSLAAAVDADCIKKVVTIAAPSQPAHVLHHFDHALTLLEQGIAASFEVAGKFYDIKPQFVSDVRQWDMQSVLTRLNRPALLFSIANDALVSEQDADELKQWIHADSTIIKLLHTDHLLSDKPANAKLVKQIVTWLNASTPTGC